MTRDDLIERAAEAMAGAEEWRMMGPEIRHGWRELARRAGTVLRPSTFSREGDPVPDDVLALGATLVLAKHAGKLTSRKADDMMRTIIAQDWIKQLRLSGYRITYGLEAPPHGTPSSPSNSPPRS